MSSKERKVVDKLIAEVSSPVFSPAVFANAIVKEHPTHQQSIMRAFMAVLEAWNDAYIHGHFDERNRGTAESAYRMYQALGDNPPPLPYI